MLTLRSTVFAEDHCPPAEQNLVVCNVLHARPQTAMLLKGHSLFKWKHL